MIRAIIVDDEFYALEGLRYELGKIQEVSVVGMFQDCQKALEQVVFLEADVVFLDIEMIDMNGMEGYQRFKEVNDRLKIIFVTAYEHYAVEAFALNAVDYLLKPVQAPRLRKSLERIEDQTSELSVPQNLYIKCFKHFEIFLNGQICHIKWRTKKSEELFAYLICAKGHFTAKEVIAEALWPGLTGDKAISNFYLAFYYLKKQESISGVDFYIQSERGKIRVIYDQIDSDLSQFDQLVFMTNDHAKASQSILKEAENLYHGMVLEEHYYDWCIPIQTKYQIKYEKLLLR